MKAFKLDYSLQNAPFQQEQKAKAEQRKLEAQQVKEEKAKLEKLKIAFNQQKSDKVNDYILSLGESQLSALKQQFYQKINESDFYKKVLAAKGQDHQIIQVHRQNFIANQFLPEEFRDFEIYQKRKLEGF